MKEYRETFIPEVSENALGIMFFASSLVYWFGTDFAWLSGVDFGFSPDETKRLSYNRYKWGIYTNVSKYVCVHDIAKFDG